MVSASQIFIFTESFANYGPWVLIMVIGSMTLGFWALISSHVCHNLINPTCAAKSVALLSTVANHRGLVTLLWGDRTVPKMGVQFSSDLADVAGCNF